jgi:hypothetical protein
MPFALDASNPDYVRAHATGRLTPADYARFEPALMAEIKRRGGRAPFLLDIRGWRGWTSSGFVRDLLFDLRHRKSFTRIAVVGNRNWHQLLTWVAKPIFPVDMRYFDGTQEAKAAGFARARGPRKP